MIMCVLLCYPLSIHMWQGVLFLVMTIYYVHPTGGWTYRYYFCFFRRPTWFPDILGNSSYPIFTKFGMQVYLVNSLYGIAFGDDSSIAN